MEDLLFNAVQAVHLATVVRNASDVQHRQAIVVRRDPELIAFTSPSNATGLIELEPEGEMLLPFESMGVDTICAYSTDVCHPVHGKVATQST